MVYFLMLYLSISVITNLKFTAPYITKIWGQNNLYNKAFWVEEVAKFSCVCSPEDLISSSADLQSRKENTKL